MPAARRAAGFPDSGIDPCLAAKAYPDWGLGGDRSRTDPRGCLWWCSNTLQRSHCRPTRLHFNISFVPCPPFDRTASSLTRRKGRLSTTPRPHQPPPRHALPAAPALTDDDHPVHLRPQTRRSLVSLESSLGPVAARPTCRRCEAWCNS